MKKYILLLLVVWNTMAAFAQSSMTDAQVLDFVVKEQSKGTSQAQIVTKLIQQGVNINQIRRVKETAEKMKSGNTNIGYSSNQDGSNRSRTNNGQTKVKGTKKDIENETLEEYAEEEETANVRSTNSLRRYSKDKNTFNENDPEYLLMQQEMDGWMPQDTAAMYEMLLKQMNKKTIKVWGRDIFSNEELSFEPNMNMALPKNYRLGPGDAVFIDIYGASQKSIQTTIAPDGIITLEGFGPISVSGLTVEQANARIRQKMGQRYKQSKIRLSVGQTHTIMVNVVGEVRTPGTYTLSAFATVFNALYMAGGISELGTLRNIKVYRNGTHISTVDVYDFLKNGNLRGNVKLADNDVIVVGAYDVLVNITGKVKRPMYYEMKRNESLGALLEYAGGFSGDAYTKYVRVFRKTGRQHSIYNVNEFDLKLFTLSDADSINVDSVISRFENMVEIKGAVFRPGKYQVGGNINSVRGLVEAAEGITEVAFTPRAVLHRTKPDRTLEIISVDLNGILNGEKADVSLQNEDVLFIPTRNDVQEERTITIRGEVFYPGVYKYAENGTLEDFILQAGGLTRKASTVKVSVSRAITNPKALTTDSLLAQTYSFSLKDGFVVDGQPGFILQPYDEIYVHRSPGYNEQQNVEVRGQVMFEGTYALSLRNARLSDILKASGGPTDIAYIAGAHLERKANESERKRMSDVLKMAREQQQKNLMEMASKTASAAVIANIAKDGQNTELAKFNIAEYYTVGINLDEALKHPGGSADIILRDGDRLIVPEYNGTVKINGAVLHPNTVAYVEGKGVNYYINKAGGFASDAKRRHTYIIYMNGNVAKVGHDAKVKPGSEIFVPTKPLNKLTLPEILSLGSSAASITAVVATIANLLKK